MLTMTQAQIDRFALLTSERWVLNPYADGMRCEGVLLTLEQFALLLTAAKRLYAIEAMSVDEWKAEADHCSAPGARPVEL